ncbi:MAG: hypothetical protein MUE98_00240 [Rhodobacteraceae bacterium]|jgi:hypothetical protein|nr:hypothetical protein [Paracoccaceae bacterium]
MARITRAEAARQLGINKSTVTRWVAKHPALADERGLVLVDEIRAHRDAMINPKLQTRGPTGAQEQDGAAPQRQETADKRPSINDHRSRTEAAKAIEAELDLAERLGLTVRRDDVERAVASAGETIRQKAAQIVRDRAERLARIDDPRAMERALDDLMRDLMSEAAAALSAAAQSVEERSAA